MSMSTNEQEMQKWFDAAVKDVKVKSEQLENNYFIPAYNHSQTYIKQRPIFATFLAIFVFLSAFPIGLFLFASLCTLGLALVIAGLFVGASLFVFLFSAGTILLLTLLSTFSLSVYFTVLGLTAYLGVRFYKHIRSAADMKTGVDEWRMETNALLFNRAHEKRELGPAKVNGTLEPLDRKPGIS